MVLVVLELRVFVAAVGLVEPVGVVLEFEVDSVGEVVQFVVLVDYGQVVLLAGLALVPIVTAVVPGEPFGVGVEP